MKKRAFLFRLALLNTFKKKFRASLAIGGIALSSAVMVLLFGIGIGLKGLVTQEISGSDAKNVITVNQRNIKEINLDQKRISDIKSISGVADVQQLVGMVGEVSYHNITLNLPMYAVTSDYFRVSPTQKTSGSISGQPTATNIILSSKALETFGVSPSAAIKRPVKLQAQIPQAYSSRQTETTRTLKAQQFTIVGSIDRDNLPVAYVPIEYLKQNGLDSVSQLKVTVTDPEKMTAVREAIEQTGLQTTSIQDSIDQVNRIFTVIQKILLLFGIIALIITVFGTFNVITLTLIEETKQIGFLRIMGMQKSSVGFLFVAQAVMLTVVGAVIGVVGGCLAGFAANGLTQAVVGQAAFASKVYVFKIPAFQIIIMLMLSIALGWLIGLMPAKRAVLIGPLEELHT
jgi:ABC-type lipoprotein release transport system permease subunit